MAKINKAHVGSDFDAFLAEEGTLEEAELPLSSYPCPVCGDPNAYPIWIDTAPPRGCSDDEAWQEGLSPRITSVCERQLARARQAADWRKRCPEAFDHEGNIIEGGLAMVMNKLRPEVIV